MRKHRDAIIRYVADELIGKGNLEIVAETFSVDYVAHAGERAYRGHAFLRRFAKQLRTAMPDLRVAEISFLARDANSIVWQRTLKGTHEAEMRGIPPSGKKVTWIDMVVSRFEAGRIAEEWVVSEPMGALLLKAPRAGETGAR